MQFSTGREIAVPLVAVTVMPILALVTGASQESLAWLFASTVLVSLVLGYQYFQNKTDKSVSADDVGRAISDLLADVEKKFEETSLSLDGERKQIQALIEDAVCTLQQSFSQVNKEAGIQNSRINEILNELDSDQVVTESHLEVVTQSKKQISTFTADAIRALQFEDLVRQLSAESRQRLRCLSKIVTTVSSELRGLQSSKLSRDQYIKGLQDLQLEVNKIYDECQNNMSKSISQQSMDEGDAVFW